MRVYYAHFMGIYNTPQEERDIKTLEALGLEVLNPNTPDIQKEVDLWKNILNYMDMFEEVFLKRVRSCDVFAFRGLPNGRIPGGVAMELKAAKEAGRIIIELPCSTISRSMDGEETREYLMDMGQR
ncbi:hypothetical protein [Leptolyngbya phage Lbo-JY46]